MRFSVGSGVLNAPDRGVCKKGTGDMAKSGKGPVIIKKYANRRLYDTSVSTYVTLDHLSKLVKDGVEFEVHDAKTGEDLTRTVLTQIILDQEASGEGSLPTSFLRQLIKFYGDGTHATLPAWLDMCMNSFADRHEKWRSSMGKAFPMNPLGLFEEQTKRNMAMFENILSSMAKGSYSNGAGKGSSSSNKSMPDIMDPLSIMQAQISAMQEQLDALKKNKP